jgi:glycerol kinase
MLAGVGAGLCTPEAARKMLHVTKTFEPKMTAAERATHTGKWEDAVRRARTS